MIDYDDIKICKSKDKKLRKRPYYIKIKNRLVKDGDIIFYHSREEARVAACRYVLRRNNEHTAREAETEAED